MSFTTQIRERDPVVVVHLAFAPAALVEPSDAPPAAVPDRFRHDSSLPPSKGDRLQQKSIPIRGKLGPKVCGPKLAPREELHPGFVAQVRDFVSCAGRI